MCYLSAKDGCDGSSLEHIMGMQYASEHGVGARVMIIMRDSRIFAL